MPTNLTGTTINSTFDQLLHIDGGPVASEKTVFSGTGVATALRLSTTAASVGNVRFSSSTISTMNGGSLTIDTGGVGTVNISQVAITSGTISGITDLAIADGGTGASDAVTARSNLGLGSIATQNSNNVTITGGAISGVTFSGSFSGMTLVESDKFTTKNGTDGVSLEDNNIFAEGTSADIDLNITPKGTGEVNVTNIDILSGKVPFTTITGRAYASFSDVTDQTGNVAAATAVKFGTNEVVGSGITMVTDGAALTRLTFAAAGTYMVAPSLQFANSDVSDHDVTVWFALNGTAIARSATKITVPKVGDGGAAAFQIVFYVTVTAGQYVQVMWLPENAAVTIDHTAAGAIAPAVPSSVVVAERIA